MNIGIFGGTFNPPHLGHLIIAEYVRERLGLAKVVFVPSAIPPHKQELEILDAHHRMEMLQFAVEGNSSFEVSDVEIRRGGISFTVDTLEEFKKRFPGEELYLLIGMDNFAEFQEWRSPERILSLAALVVMTRPNTDLTHVEANDREQIRMCVVPEIAISSSDIRRRVKEGKSIRYLVPAPVEAYIIRHHLYR